MTTKLALYFLSQDGAVRILDIDEGRTVWTIGRAPDAAICIRDLLVSKRHAEIRAELDKSATVEHEEPCYQWAIVDTGPKVHGHYQGSTNGTYITSSNGIPYRAAPGVPYRLGDRDTVQLGTSKARLRVSFDVDDTQSGNSERDTDPGAKEDADRRKTPRPEAPWWADTIMAPAWAWFIAKSSLEQMAILMMSTGAAIVVAVHVWGK
jgi:pSer/pThr/pTyr-binding forkhead associated (FHA) protein